MHRIVLWRRCALAIALMGLASGHVAREIDAGDEQPRPAKTAAQDIRVIGSRLELFVDDWLIDRFDKVRLELHHPVRREAAFEIDQPWERMWTEISEDDRKKLIAKDAWNGPTPFGFSTVLKDGDLYRLYYTWDLGSVEKALTAYAESRDGVHWVKPNLGLVEFRGSKDNNLIWIEPRFWDFNPFRDANPDASPTERYKALACGQGGANALVSPDGIRWKRLRDQPVITDGAFDSQNVAFWSTETKQYVAYYRDFLKRPDGREIRVVKRASSDDFVVWTKGELLDYGQAPLEHFYTNAVTAYFRAPHIFMGFPMRFVPGRKVVETHPYDGVSDAVFMSSRDGLRWDRRFMEGFVRPGLEPENWTERNFLVTWGIVPTSPSEISMYWVEHFRHPTIKIRRGTLRTDGFVSLKAGFDQGQVVTRPLVFEGGRLFLNFSTSAVGSVRVELLTPSGEPIAGLSGDHAPELYGDRINGEYKWTTSDARLGAWSGKPVRLRIRLQDADVYALQFRD